MNDTINYYNENAIDFYNNTKDANMAELYEKFLTFLPKGAKILDLGCGSGRDTKFFLENGYECVAADASIEMVKLSSELTGKKTLHLRFDEIDFDEEFDGVWACASLLHARRSEMDDIFKRIYKALRKDGIFYSSFKYGDKEEFRNGRFFNFYDEKSFNELLKRNGYFELLEMFITTDVREGRQDEKWLNVLVRKK
ncbi:methyltransferase domain-containing protein [Caloramator sp. CAR-1]|uniref:class I SAM-dependent methyltransferase n=1 Tax=Caloramator sp. CAR-1 TaxID=3062777 RepID=UPI0026E24A52|nr:methyltransferase domain-containing protein [Caloramator sp. CAR-1]MDO6355149.1 methyltransferase domain-containing protein [Caloramator sp. CAR-1]